VLIFVIFPIVVLGFIGVLFWCIHSWQAVKLKEKKEQEGKTGKKRRRLSLGPTMATPKPVAKKEDPVYDSQISIVS
jgi:hypothetical protein